MYLLLAATSAYAAERYALGNGNVALKVDYFSFTDDVFDDIDLASGVYVGLEGSLALTPNFYLAVESGWAGLQMTTTLTVLGNGPVDVEIDVTYVPV